MIVISHRGLWTVPAEKNTKGAFRRSFDAGFGTETDVRDAVGELVISHDMPVGGEMRFDEFVGLSHAAELPLAVNIKSDGLAGRLHEAAARHRLRDWFVFDMSIPDMRDHLRAGNPVFTRMSEVEREPAWLDESQGVWLDAFTTDWFDAAVIEGLLARDKRVCVVSPELHGRTPDAVWSVLQRFRSESRVILCTDCPDRARDYFEVAA